MSNNLNNKINYDFHSNHELSLNKSFFEKKGLCGLVNVGNTCFLNSILQCLSHTLKLTDYFLSKKYVDDYDNINKNKKEYKLLNSYINLMNNCWQVNQLIKPKTFLDNLSLYISKYSKLQQQDSHECLIYILDKLHKALAYEVDVCISGEPKTKHDQLMKTSLESWKKFYKNDYSYIIELFNGMIYTQINCISDNCKYSDDIFEPFNSLSLDIPFQNSINPTNLDECLTHYFQNDEKIQSWRCEKCNNNGCDKSSKLWSLPNYLIIQLKRFDNTSKNVSKNNKEIEFPIDDLNLTKYISKDKNDPNNYIYSLYAVNYHTGSLNSGHYWSSCKNLDNNWYLFNDGHVTKTNPSSDAFYKDAYLLFYYRKFIKN